MERDPMDNANGYSFLLNYFIQSLNFHPSMANDFHANRNMRTEFRNLRPLDGILNAFIFPRNFYQPAHHTHSVAITIPLPLAL